MIIHSHGAKIKRKITIHPVPYRSQAYGMGAVLADTDSRRKAGRWHCAPFCSVVTHSIRRGTGCYSFFIYLAAVFLIRRLVPILSKATSRRQSLPAGVDDRTTPLPKALCSTQSPFTKSTG